MSLKIILTGLVLGLLGAFFIGNVKAHDLPSLYQSGWV
jgi:hypothetical protein